MNIRPTNHMSGIPKVTEVTEVRVNPHSPQPQQPVYTYDELNEKTVSDLLAFAAEYYGLTIPYNWRKSKIIKAILKEQPSKLSKKI